LYKHYTIFILSFATISEIFYIFLNLNLSTHIETFLRFFTNLVVFNKTFVRPKTRSRADSFSQNLVDNVHNLVYKSLFAENQRFSTWITVIKKAKSFFPNFVFLVRIVNFTQFAFCQPLKSRK